MVYTWCARGGSPYITRLCPNVVSPRYRWYKEGHIIQSHEERAVKEDKKEKKKEKKKEDEGGVEEGKRAKDKAGPDGGKPMKVIQHFYLGQKCQQQ